MHETGAEHVTMLQRSPGYFINLPTVDPVNNFFRRWFPSDLAHRIIRLRILIMSYAFFYYCHYFPNHAIGLIRRNTEKELPPNIPVDPHFVPSYRPWEQRMCISPNGDFFQALRSGKADIATGHIKTVTSSGITLKSGQTLDADIIITATGLKVSMCGNATLAVDGQQVCIGDKYIWRGSMLESVPNLAFFMGYTNASWTLGSDATARLFVRLLKDMESRGETSMTATVDEGSSMQPQDMLNLNSSYIQAAVRRKQFPMTGNVAPWKPRRNYFVDSWFASYGDVARGLVFRRVAP
jgi:cation diffusion facilitator CzcD-associated flavoprotein CzcO